jgi:hypothetical protein
VYAVAQGTAAASPTKASLPVGATELATVQVAAGATSTNGAGVTITNTARQAVARGARVPVRSQAERDALTAYAGLEVYRLDTGYPERYSAAYGWQTIRNRAFRTTAFTAGTWAATNNYNLATLTVDPQIGPYSVDLHASQIVTTSAGMSGSLRITQGATVLASDRYTQYKDSAQPIRMGYDVPDGSAVTFVANIEVLAGSATTYVDIRNTFLEARVYPL